MKPNWQTKKLGEILKLEYGKPLLKNSRNVDGKYPVYGANGIKNYSNKFYFNKLSIIVGRKGSAGEINLTKEKFWPLDVTYFVTFDDKKYDLKFLYNLLETLELQKLAKGVKPGINRHEVYSINVKIPALPEQKQIVKTLDKVFREISKAKENTEKNLQNVKELFESYLQNIFANPGKDWEEKSLGEFLKLEYGKPLDKKDRNGNGKFPVYGANGEKDRTDKFYYNKSTIIVGRKGSAGELNLTENKFWPLDVTYFVVFDEKKYNLKFIYFLLSTLQLTKLAKGVKPGINRNDVYSINVFIPNLKEQKAIVKKLDELSEKTKKLEEIYKQKLADLEELKKSILHKAFAGKL